MGFFWEGAAQSSRGVSPFGISRSLREFPEEKGESRDLGRLLFPPGIPGSELFWGRIKTGNPPQNSFPHSHDFGAPNSRGNSLLPPDFFEEWPWESGRGEGFGIPLDLPRSLEIPREAPRNPGSFRVGFGGVGIPSFQSFFGGRTWEMWSFPGLE